MLGKALLLCSSSCGIHKRPFSIFPYSSYLSFRIPFGLYPAISPISLFLCRSNCLLSICSSYIFQYYYSLPTLYDTFIIFVTKLLQSFLRIDNFARYSSYRDKSLFQPYGYFAEPFLAVTPFARMPLSRRLLSEPYLDADLHDVLLHLPSQIPDHMPCTDSLPVSLPSTKNIR